MQSLGDMAVMQCVDEKFPDPVLENIPDLMKSTQFSREEILAFFVLYKSLCKAVQLRKQ